MYMHKCAATPMNAVWDLIHGIFRAFEVLEGKQTSRAPETGHHLKSPEAMWGKAGKS